MIEKLYYMITENLKASEDYLQAQKDYNKMYEKIAELLPDEIKLLDDLFFHTGGLESEYGQMCFKEGFKLAFKLAAESYL